MKYSGASMPLPPRSCAFLFGAAMTKKRISGNATEKMKKRRLRNERMISYRV